MRDGDDGGIATPKTGAVSPVTDGVLQFHGFCNVGLVFGAGEALVVDASNPRAGGAVAGALKEATNERLALLVYTHGHVDHVGGAPAFLSHAESAGHERPTVWAHENVPKRLDRYLATWGWNQEVNRRQFALPQGVEAFPRRFVYPDRTYREEARLDLSGEPVELHHAEAETDDATWVWLPERGVALVGDLCIGSLPNTGNPNKPQRHTLGWARALDAIGERRPRYVIPGHGDCLQGDLALEVLAETARALRILHDAVLERLNAGLWPDEVVESDVRLPDDLARKPYLQPIYGCVPFVVRDVLRAYAGWWGGNPAELLPAPRAEVARDVCEAAGRDALLARIEALRSTGELRRALHLAVLLGQADPHDRAAAGLVAELCEGLAETERSFIARSLYRAAAARAREPSTG